jgi:hypothetical protein
MDLIYNIKKKFIYNMRGGGDSTILIIFIIFIILLAISAGVYYFLIFIPNKPCAEGQSRVDGVCTCTPGSGKHWNHKTLRCQCLNNQLEIRGRCTCPDWLIDKTEPGDNPTRCGCPLSTQGIIGGACKDCPSNTMSIGYLGYCCHLDEVGGTGDYLNGCGIRNTPLPSGFQRVSN